MNKIASKLTEMSAEYAVNIEKQAGVKRLERIMSSVTRKMLGGKKALKSSLDSGPHFFGADIAAAGMAGGRKNVSKSLMAAGERAMLKAERRVKRFKPGESVYAHKLLTQFRGYGHADSLGRRITAAARVIDGK